MSSRPGWTLEEFVMWEHDLIVDGDDGANESLRISEWMGQPTRRVSITKEQFMPILSLYEPYRKQVESLLSDFNDDEQSWRDYAGYAFDFITANVFKQANEIRCLRANIGGANG